MSIPTNTLAWLAAGGALQVLSFGRWLVPVAAWLAPAFLLHVTQSTPPLEGFSLVALALTVALSIGNRNVIAIPGPAYFGVVVLIALGTAMPFLADRLLVPHLPASFAALVFPLAWTALEFLGLRVSPYGSWGALGYTQHGNLPLMQTASVTGIWGIGFLMTWFAAVVNLAWTHDFAWVDVHGDVVLYVATWCAVMLAGGVRLLRSPQAPSVRAAGIGWPPGIIEPERFMRAIAPDLAPAERDELREAFRQVQDAFFTRTRREAQSGARIIVWPEGNLMVFEDDEAVFLGHARQLAREQGIQLLMGMATLSPGAARPVHNKAVLVSAAGEAMFSYTKITAVPGPEMRMNRRGAGPLPVVDTPHGRIGAAICFDLDFPWLVRQAGRARADLLLVPASDWRGIGRLHQAMAEFRAIENGVALLRIARWGNSGAVDAYGRRLATLDDFATPGGIMVAQVPASAGVHTLYTRIGDAFAWACVAGLFSCVVLAVLRG